MSNGQMCLGIHIGVEEVCASIYRYNRCQVVLKTPAYITITEVGEILAGARALGYRATHEGAPYYSVFDLMKNGRRFHIDYISHKGVRKSLHDVGVAFAKDLKKQLVERLGETVENCILSVSCEGLLYKENLKKIMSEAGFVVKRIIHSSFACAISEIDRGPKDFRYQILSVTSERSFLNISLIDYDQDVAEVLCTKQFEVPDAVLMDVQEISQKGYVLIEKAYPEFHDELKNAVIRVYVQGAKGTTMDLGDNASGGATLVCAALAGDYSACLYLDVTEIAYGVEIVNADGAIVQPLEWIVEQQMTIPVKRLIECKPLRIIDDLKLRIYAHSEKIKQEADVIEIDFKKIFPNVFGAIKIQSISLSLDSNKNVMAEFLTDRGRNYVLKVTDIYPAENRKVSKSLEFVAMDIEEELFRVIALTKKMDDIDALSPTGSGLAIIAKQCKSFLRKYELEDIQRCLVIEKETQRMIEDILDIVDNLEYGVRDIKNDKLTNPDIWMAESYDRFLRMLQKELDVVPILAEGMVFDTDIHHAMLYEKRDGFVNHLIADELQKGYYWRGKVLRPSKVKVIN